MNIISRALAAAALAAAVFAGTLKSVQAQDGRWGIVDRAALENIAQKQADGKLVDAVQKYEDGDSKGAKSLLDNMLKTSPDNDAAWYYRGMCDISLQDAESAERDLKKAVSLDSTNFWYRYMLAKFYGATGRVDLTIDMYETLLQDFPKKSDLYYGLANLYMSQGQNDKALKTIDDIETQFGKSDATALTKFDILNSQGRGEEAYKSLEEYNREYSSPQVLSMLGDYQMGMYNDSSALAYYNEALALDHSFAPAMLGKAEAYRMTRDYASYFTTLDALMGDRDAAPESKSAYLKAVVTRTSPQFLNAFRSQFDSTMAVVSAAHPSDTSVLKVTGTYYLMTNRLDDAVGAYRKVMDETPEDLESAATYAQLLLYTGDADRVVAVCDSARTKFPDTTVFLEIANAAEYGRKNYRQVIANCEKMLRVAPSDTSVCLSAWATIGDMYHLLGDQDRAYKAYDNALKINPGSVQVLNNYAYYLSESGKKLKKAYAMSRRTVEAEPDNATYLDTFGWILFLQGKALEAKPFFKHAMLYGGKESAVILEHYAAVLEALGENDLAKVYRQQAKNKAAEGKE